MDSYFTGLEREDFVPSPGMQCMGCKFSPCRFVCQFETSVRDLKRLQSLAWQ